MSDELVMLIATMAIIMTDQYPNRIVLVIGRTLNGMVFTRVLVDPVYKSTFYFLDKYILRSFRPV